jgi:branched-chain amino acid aminotransferase
MKDTKTAEIKLYVLAGNEAQAIDLPDKEAILTGLHDGLPSGVYTAMRTFDHINFLHLGDHLSRLEKSMAMLGWSYKLDMFTIRHALHRVCSDYEHHDSRVRIDVLSRDESRLIDGNRVLISLTRFELIPEDIYRLGVQVGIEGELYRNQPEVKKAEFAVLRRRYLERDPTRFECLITDAKGAILEGTTSNFFGVRDGVLWTAGKGILEGIARMIILKLAAKAKIPVRLRPVDVAALPEFSETALSSASRGLVPIVQIGDQLIGDGRPGPIAWKLIDSYQAYVVRKTRPAI